MRVVVSEQQRQTGDGRPWTTFATALHRRLRDRLRRSHATWLSRFTDTTRQAASYRARAGAPGRRRRARAYPAGGQGLNIGVQDAVNLGWKLAQVVNGTSPESLLDTYQAERHPVAARVLQSTMAQTALTRADERTTPCARRWPSCWRWTSRASATPG